MRDQYWSRGERVPVPGPSWALPIPMLWEAGERPGSACAIEVKGLKRRPQHRGAAQALSLGVTRNPNIAGGLRTKIQG